MNDDQLPLETITAGSGRRRARRCRHLVVAATLATVLAVVALGPGSEPSRAAAQSAVEEPGLEQTIDRDELVVAGPASLASGHVDIGPRYVDGAWTLLVHDDSTDEPVWRSLDETVLRVDDAALLTVPDDPAYSFVGAAPGAGVHVVPQTQDPDVVWLGWNTQDPEVMATIDRGATLTLHGVDGPGELTMYLQSGTLGAPEVLWSSRISEPQPIWVDVNTHTHANWVFTEPGAYLVRVEVSADLITGEEVSDIRTLRFAVGSATTDAAARSSSSAGATTPFGNAVAQEVPVDAAGLEPVDDGAGGGALIVVSIAIAVVLCGAVGSVIVRGRRARAVAYRDGGGELP